ncbi:hypothetical protein OIV83_005833 [Microbotryomycetes sp. JL201]|nr:hypothetical protein OIV83_005833 [Microbotryomycetes sp. JL201]
MQGYTVDANSPAIAPPPIAKDSPYAAAQIAFQQEAAFLPRSAILQPPPAVQKHAADSPAPQESAVGYATSDDGSELYIPGLTSTSLFTEIPDSDSIAALVEKYIPPQNRPARDLSGDWQGHTIDELIAARKWRAIARYCHDTILDASPEQTSYLLALWCLRLQAILRLRLVEQFAAEVVAIAALMPEPPQGRNFHALVPFELRVYQVNVLALRGNSKAALTEYSFLIKACKAEMWAAQDAHDEVSTETWRKRADRVAGMLCSAMQDMQANASCLNQLRTRGDITRSPALLQAVTRYHVATGNVTTAQNVFTPADASTSNVQVQKAQVLAHVGNGAWTEAEKALRMLVKVDPRDVEARSNLAVVLLFMSRLQDAIQVYQELIKDMPEAAYASETVLFNLATLLELRTEAATASKIRLLNGVAARGVQGLRAGCLKLIL